MPLFPPTSARARQFLRTAPPFLWHLLTGRPVTISAIAANLFQGLVPPARVQGTEWIPPDSPFVVLINHYENPQVAAWWAPALVTRIVAERRKSEPREVHWVMASAWSYPGGFGRYVKQPLTKLLFQRIAQVLGLVLVPPVLEGDPNRGQGVTGVRQALSLTRGPTPRLIGIAPEGHAGPGGQLKAPPPGAGLFLLLLTHDTIPCLPVGWYQDEQNGITIRFGAPFQLQAPRSKDREARDHAAAAQAMVEIGKLLPERLGGVYRDQIDQGNMANAV
ncbi:MAG: hypothetical protein WCF84_26215 [Anaerolineae bacterium]